MRFLDVNLLASEKAENLVKRLVRLFSSRPALRTAKALSVAQAKYALSLRQSTEK
jgi:hypothetical protein